MNKYPNGYLPKFIYHVSKGNLERAKSFMSSHVEKYGSLTDEQCNYLSQELKKLNKK